MDPPNAAGTAMERSVVMHKANVEKYMQFCAHACGCPSCCKARMRAAKNRMASIGANSTVVQAAFIKPITLGNSTPVNSAKERHTAMTSCVEKKTTARIIVHMTAGAGFGSLFRSVVPGGR